VCIRDNPDTNKAQYLQDKIIAMYGTTFTVQTIPQYISDIDKAVEDLQK
jgi:hypothetical protein